METLFLNVFTISFNTLNLFSFIMGMIFGLSTGAFNRYRTWWLVVMYFMGVAGFYAIKSGAAAQYIR